MVEVYIVRDKNFIVKQVENVRRNIFKWRRILHHFVCDPGERADVNGYFPFGVNQRGITLNYLLAVMYAYGYLGDAICTGMPPGSLNIHNGIHWRKCRNFLLIILVET